MGLYMYCDGHIHILHGMDNGPAFAEDAVRMLQIAQDRGLRRMVITPHFYSERESCATFLLRRKQRMREFTAAVRAASVPMTPHILTAEVQLCPGISHEAMLGKLLVPKTRYLPIDVPLGKFERWMMVEFSHLIHKRNIYPLICNIERHIIFSSEKDYKILTSLPHAVYQTGINALTDIRLSHALFRLLHMDKTVICGSNAHDPYRRPPETPFLYDRIVELHGRSVYKTLILQTNAFFNESFS